MPNATLQSHAPGAVSIREPNSATLIRATGTLRPPGDDSFDGSGSAFAVARASVLRNLPRMSLCRVTAELASNAPRCRSGRTSARCANELRAQVPDQYDSRHAEGQLMHHLTLALSGDIPEYDSFYRAANVPTRGRRNNLPRFDRYARGASKPVRRCDRASHSGARVSICGATHVA